MTLPAWLAGRRLTAADLRADGNAFTLLRWLLASSVMFSHAYDLTLGARGRDPSVDVFGRPVSELAVFLFFTVSGFLVTGSLAKRGWRDFAVARLLRLVPGLWVMLAVITLGLGLAFGTLPFGAYLSDGETWRFVLRNASLVTAAYQLPGVFTDLPFNAVNGSLWTIPQEVHCYIALGLLGVLGALVARRWLTLALVVLTVVQLAVPLDAVPALDRPRRLALSFLIGVVAWLWRDRLRWSWPLALGGAAASILLAGTAVPPAPAMVGAQVAFAYLLGVAAFRSPAPLRRFSAALPDYSYGIYIYAFPVQQVVIALGWGLTPLGNLWVSFLVLLPVAAASWHAVESPALALKARALRRDAAKLSADFTTR